MSDKVSKDKGKLRLVLVELLLVEMENKLLELEPDPVLLENNLKLDLIMKVLPLLEEIKLELNLMTKLWVEINLKVELLLVVTKLDKKSLELVLEVELMLDQAVVVLVLENKLDLDLMVSLVLVNLELETVVNLGLDLKVNRDLVPTMEVVQEENVLLVKSWKLLQKATVKEVVTPGLSLTLCDPKVEDKEVEEVKDMLMAEMARVTLMAGVEGEVVVKLVRLMKVLLEGEVNKVVPLVEVQVVLDQQEVELVKVKVLVGLV
jgi:hypothetical protein